VGVTVTELIARLAEVPGDWEAYGTRSGSIEVREPGGWRKGMKYAFVFPDGRATRHYTAQRG